MEKFPSPTSSQFDAAEQARIQSRILIESLPYLREFHNQIVVIKYGGHAMTEDALKQAFALNVALLKFVGIHPVIVHGGGPQINIMLDKLAIKSEFRRGQRVTDAATMDVVEMVLVGSVNKDIVNQINQAGVRAVGLSGKDGMLLTARKLSLSVPRGELPPEIIDLGNVGEPVAVNTQLLHSLIRDDFIPVIAPVGVDESGATYNINADSVAGAVAGALKAKRLLLLTDVAGILDKTGQLVRSLNPEQAKLLCGDGTITGGMIPKLDCCLAAVADGVGMATIVDGRVENCLLLELLTDKGVGTAVVG